MKIPKKYDHMSLEEYKEYREDIKIFKASLKFAKNFKLFKDQKAIKYAPN